LLLLLLLQLLLLLLQLLLLLSVFFLFLAYISGVKDRLVLQPVFNTPELMPFPAPTSNH